LWHSEIFWDSETLWWLRLWLPELPSDKIEWRRCPFIQHPTTIDKTKMTDQKYIDTLGKADQDMAMIMSVNKCLPSNITYYKDIIRALNIAQRRANGVFTKTGGKFYNCGLMRDEIKRLLTIRPIIIAPLPICDYCQEPVESDDQAWSKDKDMCIHMNCDGDWEETAGCPFPYEYADSESEAESEVSMESKAERVAKKVAKAEGKPYVPPAPKPVADASMVAKMARVAKKVAEAESEPEEGSLADLAVVFTTPSGTKVWRTIADPEDPNWGVDDCYVWTGKSFDDAGAFLGKWYEAEKVIKRASGKVSVS